jgi:hypothetical protein
MKILKSALTILLLIMLPGCAAIPYGPGNYAATPGYYSPAPAYYGPARAYYGPPVYYGPSIGVGVYGGRRGHGHHGRGHRR